MRSFHHSVTLDEEKCKGCTTCIRRCPTEAIRVRDGKARIISKRCIDCGECIRVCPHRAKRAVCDNKEMLNEFRYTIAMPAPTLYGQFSNLMDIDYVLSAFIDIGFDDVFEVARAAEIVSDATRRMMKEKAVELPVISSACPAVVRLIRARFPSLCEKVLPLLSPMQVAGRMAKEEAAASTGYRYDEIGVFFITPCPAKVTDVIAPIGVEESWVDGVLSMSDLYPALLEKMNQCDKPRQLSKSGIIGVSWARSGGEAAALLQERYLAADGVEHVIDVLEELENERLKRVEFVELNACPGGCVGGVLTVENPYVAKARIQLLRKYLPVALNRLENRPIETITWQKELEYADVMRLSDDLMEAIEMLQRIEELEQVFPGIDCGSCGAPSCRALAEDIVSHGKARKNDCIFILRQEASVAGIELSQNMVSYHAQGTGGEDYAGEVTD